MVEQLENLIRWIVGGKEMTRIQLKTIASGTLEALIHNGKPKHPASDSIENPCSEALAIRKEALQFVSEITSKVLKVKVDGKLCCVKSADKTCALA